MSCKWVALVVSMCVLCAPAVHAAPIKKDAKAKVELKKKDPTTTSTKATLKGFASVEKKVDATGKTKLKKSLKLDFEKDAKLGDLKLKNLKVEEFKLPLSSAKKDKKLILTVGKLDPDTGAKKKKDASFLALMQFVPTFERSGLISGFSLNFLTDGKPLPSQDGGLGLLGFTVRVSEPTTLLLLAAGLLGLAWGGNRKRIRRTV